MENRRTRPRQRQRVVGTEHVATERKQGREVVDATERNTSPSHDVPMEYARVRVEGSVTQNMGDFNSVRVGVLIERPCANTDEAIDATYRDVSRTVDEYLQQELELATGAAS